jgi:tRNA U34 5-methylaminomethyl-2-thiouridine-forming methyltransferase MnmC
MKFKDQEKKFKKDNENVLIQEIGQLKQKFENQQKEIEQLKQIVNNHQLEFDSIKKNCLECSLFDDYDDFKKKVRIEFSYKFLMNFCLVWSMWRLITTQSLSHNKKKFQLKSRENHEST